MLERSKSMGCISHQGGEPSMRDIVRNFLGLIFLVGADIIVMADIRSPDHCELPGQ